MYSGTNVEEIIMKTKNLGILVFLVAIAVTMGSASAATVNVNSGMTPAQIQGNISAATAGDTINFASGTYNGISLTINKALNLVGNGATIVGNGSSVFIITGTTGVSINGFNININNPSADGITGSNVYSCSIQNNNITNGDDGINIFKQYGGLTINNNRVTNMNAARDGISLVNCVSSTSTSTSITNNVVDGLNYGIFVGGYFRGLISGNTLNNIGLTGMNITGKNAATTGNLYANITNNDITSTGVGISMENPDVVYLNLTGNTVSSGSDSLLKGYYYTRDANIQLTNSLTGNTYDNLWDPLTTNGH